MDQQRIMDLLVEASTAEGRRVSQIQVELDQAIYHPVADAFEKGRGQGIHVVLGALYVETYTKDPALLPTLFPAFAIMCGPKDGTIVNGKIDWSIYEAVVK